MRDQSGLLDQMALVTEDTGKDDASLDLNTDFEPAESCAGQLTFAWAEEWRAEKDQGFECRKDAELRDRSREYRIENRRKNVFTSLKRQPVGGRKSVQDEALEGRCGRGDTKVECLNVSRRSASSQGGLI